MFNQTKKVTNRERGLSMVASIIIVSVALVLIGAWSLFNKGSDHKNSEVVKKDEVGIEWLSYNNSDFGFELEYPKGWRIEENNDDYVPNIRVIKDSLKKGGDQIYGETSVSILPLGLPRGAYAGRPYESDFGTDDSDISYVTDYRLINGETYLRHITYSNPPESWEDFGFISLGVAVENPEYACSKDGELVDISACDPYQGYNFEVGGEISQQDFETELKILESIRFK